LIWANDVERSFDAFGRDVHGGITSERSARDPKHFLLEHPIVEELGDLVVEFSHVRLGSSRVRWRSLEVDVGNDGKPRGSNEALPYVDFEIDKLNTCLTHAPIEMLSLQGLIGQAELISGSGRRLVGLDTALMKVGILVAGCPYGHVHG
jgi:hypothetical protein